MAQLGVGLVGVDVSAIKLLTSALARAWLHGSGPGRVELEDPNLKYSDRVGSFAVLTT